MNELKWCISYLKSYNNRHFRNTIPEADEFRSLMNITMPYDLTDEYYENEAVALRELRADKEITDANDFADGLSLFKGDITLIRADAIVNACNSQLLGCFQPMHKCVDNAIHSYAGLQVRRDLMKVMAEQGHDEPNGKCKVTKGYSLPSNYIFHTVGPVFRNAARDFEDLKNCYLSCLEAADRMGLSSIAFPSISTGIYGFPIDEASKIAVSTADEYLKSQGNSLKKVMFVTYSEGDFNVYKERLEEAHR